MTGMKNLLWWDTGGLNRLITPLGHNGRVHIHFRFRKCLLGLYGQKVTSKNNL